MSPEKSAFEQELTALFIESGKDAKSGIQGAIEYVAKEQLAKLRSTKERLELQLQIRQALEISRISEQNILLRLNVESGVGRYDFVFDFTNPKQKSAFLVFQEDVIRLLQLRYLHSPETLKSLLEMVDR